MIGAAELIIIGIVVACPLVVLFAVIYLVRGAGGGGMASAEEAQILRELVDRMNAMDQRMSGLETVLLEKEYR